MAETTSSAYPAALDSNTSLLGDQVNQKSLTLSGAHTNSVTTITTTATISGVNAPGYCLVDSELIHFTGVSGATLTGATRAADNTTAATHADGATVYFVPVANWANQLKRAIVATQTELGTDPAGAFTDVNTSLNTWLLGVTNSITAGATQTQAGATALTKNTNRVTVVGTNGDGVKLPTAVAGLEILIINDDSAQTLKIWPADSDAIDGGSADAVDANQLAAGSSRRYIAVDGTNWYTATVAVDVADNSITLAKMAGGTDGNIISYDASGDPVAIATGDDGEVLTSAGAGAPPAFEAAAGGGGKILQVQYQTYGTEQENNTDTWAVTGLQKAITPAHTSNTILVMASIRSCYKASADTYIGFRLKRAISGGATTYVVLDDLWGYTADGGVRQNLTNDIVYVDAPSTTAEITYDIEFRSETDEATCRVQNSGTVTSGFVLMEVDGT